MGGDVACPKSKQEQRRVGLLNPGGPLGVGAWLFAQWRKVDREVHTGEKRRGESDF